MAVQSRQFAVRAITVIVTVGASLLVAAGVFTVTVCAPMAWTVVGNTLFSTDAPAPTRSTAAVVVGGFLAWVALVVVSRFVGRRVYRSLSDRYLAASIAYRAEVRDMYGQLSLRDKRALYQSLTPARRRGLMRELTPESQRELAGLHESLA